MVLNADHVGPCPEPEQLGAYAEGRLTGEARAAIEAHLADCQDCCDLLTDVTAIVRELTPDVKEVAPARVLPFWRRPRVQAVGGGILALAASLILVVQLRPEWNPFRQPTPYEELVAAVGTNRTIEGRLTGGFRYGRYQSPTRGGRATISATDYELLAAVARIQKEAEARETPGILRALGVARLVVGDVEGAVVALEDAVAAAPNAESLSDLSAAYLARARTLERPDDYPKALAAAQRAVGLTPDLQAAVFNQALALEALSLTDRATEAWRHYLDIADHDDWRTEAERRLAALGAGQSAVPQQGMERLADESLGRDAIRRRAVEDTQLARETLEDHVLAAWAREFGSNRAAPLAQRALLIAEALDGSSPDRFYSTLRSRYQPLLSSTAEPSKHLAAAHLAYAEGKRLQSVDRPVDAAAFFSRALVIFARARSPYAAWCRLHVARARNFAGEKERAIEELTDVEALARRNGFLSLQARALMLLGEASFGATHFERAYRLHSDALDIYQRLGERDSTATLHQALAETLSMLGEPRLAWSHFMPALRFVSRMREPRRKHSVLVSASIFAIQQGQPECAEPLLTTAFEIDEAAGLPLGAAEALLNRARVLARTGRRDEARADLQQAAAWQGRILDRVLAARVASNLAAAEAEVTSERRPDAAIARLTQSIAGYTANANLFRLVRLYLARARLHRVLGDGASAEADLRSGIELLELQQGTISELSLRVSHFDDVWDIYGDMIDLQLDKRDLSSALHYAEASRGRGLRGAPASRDIRIDALVARLPATATAVVYTVLPDRVVYWRLRGGSLSAGEAGISRTRLEQLIQRFVRYGPDPGGYREFLAAGSELFTRLVSPVIDDSRPGELMVVVPDGWLAAVPFGALFDTRTRQFLFERATLAVAPSLTSLANYASSTRIPARHALVVASGSVQQDEGLDALPAVRHEAASVARTYAEAVLLADANVTKPRLLDELRSAELLHFAGHAVTNDVYPSLSRLVLPGDLEDHLYATEVASLDLRRLRVVVLAACSTGAGQIRRGAGALSLARSFLSAGASAVVALGWKVPDEEAAALLTAFHRSYSETADAVLSLRRAQDHMRSRGRAAYSHAWTGAWVTIGDSTNAGGT